ncbi:hypothetical protein [Photobacterium leiognathi]|uniref:hypothetical protein n=1 Tax=Photobacterium leiognathi TaxID=553611 RepID=UPI002735CE5F|nr:hypothetical protein [Photobacterium leiognathi]
MAKKTNTEGKRLLQEETNKKWQQIDILTHPMAHKRPTEAKPTQRQKELAKSKFNSTDIKGACYKKLYKEASLFNRVKSWQSPRILERSHQKYDRQLSAK